MFASMQTKMDQLISKNLRRLLQEKGISQADFARKIEMDPSLLSQIVQGKKGAGKMMVEKFADILGVSLGEFFRNGEGGGSPLQISENKAVNDLFISIFAELLPYRDADRVRIAGEIMDLLSKKRLEE